MKTLCKCYKEILKDLSKTHPLLFYMHMFFISAAMLTLLIVIFNWIFHIEA